MLTVDRRIASRLAGFVLLVALFLTLAQAEPTYNGAVYIAENREQFYFHERHVLYMAILRAGRFLCAWIGVPFWSWGILVSAVSAAGTLVCTEIFFSRAGFALKPRIAAVALVGTSHPFLFMATTVESYAPQFLAMACLLGWLWEWKDRPSMRCGALLLLAMLAAVGFHASAAFLVLTAGGAMIVHQLFLGPRGGAVWLALLCALTAGALWLVIDWRSGGDAFASQLAWAHSIARETVPALPPFSRIVSSNVLWCFLAAPGLLGLLPFALVGGLRENRWPHAVPFATLTIHLIVFGLWAPDYGAFYGAVLLLAAWPIAALPEHWRPSLFVLTLLAVWSTAAHLLDAGAAWIGWLLLWPLALLARFSGFPSCRGGAELLLIGAVLLQLSASAFRAASSEPPWRVRVLADSLARQFPDGGIYISGKPPAYIAALVDNFHALRWDALVSHPAELPRELKLPIADYVRADNHPVACVFSFEVPREFRNVFKNLCRDQLAGFQIGPWTYRRLDSIPHAQFAIEAPSESNR